MPPCMVVKEVFIMVHLHITSVRCKTPVLYNNLLMTIIVIIMMMMFVNCLRGFKHLCGIKR